MYKERPRLMEVSNIEMERSNNEQVEGKFSISYFIR